MKIGEEPCGNCGHRMYDCFQIFTTKGGRCCPACDGHGYRLTERGRAAIEAMDDGLSYEDAKLLHGKRREP